MLAAAHLGDGSVIGRLGNCAGCWSRMAAVV
jgi:hypothetical protein